MSIRSKPTRLDFVQWFIMAEIQQKVVHPDLASQQFWQAKYGKSELAIVRLANLGQCPNRPIHIMSGQNFCTGTYPNAPEITNPSNVNVWGCPQGHNQQALRQLVRPVGGSWPVAGADLFWEKSIVDWSIDSGWCWYVLKEKYYWLVVASAPQADKSKLCHCACCCPCFLRYPTKASRWPREMLVVAHVKTVMATIETRKASSRGIDGVSNLF
jgi:hypothetical protein